MAVYHRKPATVNAVQWFCTNEEEMIELLPPGSYMVYRNQITNVLVFDVWTNGKIKRLNYKDVVIKDSNNELSIIHEKSFKQNYELVED